MSVASNKMSCLSVLADAKIYTVPSDPQALPHVDFC